jgi:hypothetical protein
LQGDANSWLDSYTPSVDEVLGKEWIYVPGFGKYLEKARQPEWLAAIVVVFALMTVWPGGSEDDGNKQQEKAKLNEVKSMSSQQRVHEMIYLFLTVAGIGLIGLVFFFARPTTEIAEEFSVLDHQGAFSYEASSSEEVYSSGKAITGEPIFRYASSGMTLNFRYSQNRPDLQTVENQGTYELILEIRDESGWTRRIELLPESEFSGNEVEVSGKIWFHQVDAVIKAFEEATKVSRGVYTLSVIPVISFEVADQGDMTSVFSPSLDFHYSDLEVRVIRSMDSDVFAPTQEFVFTSAESQEAAIKLLSFSLPVRAGRWVFGSLLVISLVGVGFLVRHDHSMRSREPSVAVHYQYGALLARVHRVPAAKDTVMVEDFDALASIAEQNGKNVFRAEKGRVNKYFVLLDSRMFLLEMTSGQNADEGDQREE